MMTNSYHKEQIFYLILSKIIIILLAHHYLPNFIRKKTSKRFHKILNTLRCDKLTSFYITMTLWIYVQPACNQRAAAHFFIFSMTSTDMRDRIISHWKS